MNKKFLSILLVFVMFSNLFLGISKTSYADEDNFSMPISEDEGVIASYDDSTRTLTISGNGKIAFSKWKEMIENMPDRYIKNSSGKVNKFWNDDTGDLIINFSSVDNGILLCDSEVDSYYTDSLFHNFKGTINFNNSVDLSEVTNMAGYFLGTENISGNLSNWNTSNVTDMSHLFENSNNFSADISGWDTSNVTNMSAMFENCKNFNSNVNDWVTSSLTDMSSIFAGTEDFSTDISRWNTSKVTNISYMFTGSKNFSSNVSGLNTLNVKDMSYLFSKSENFSADISLWDTSNVESMHKMFTKTNNFNVDVSKWNTSNVKDMSFMFSWSKGFGSDISQWDTSNVENMIQMFSYTKNFASDISNWDTSNVNDMRAMFEHCNIRDISLLNRGSAQNTDVYKTFNDTLCDTYKFKGLKFFIWELPESYEVKNISNNTIEYVPSGTKYNFSANDEYHLRKTGGNTPPEEDKFTVEFKDYDGKILKTEEVEKGKSATPPADPSREGYKFIGWDKPYNNIADNLVVIAKYEIEDNPPFTNFSMSISDIGGVVASYDNSEKTLTVSGNGQISLDKWYQMIESMTPYNHFENNRYHWNSSTNELTIIFSSDNGGISLCDSEVDGDEIYSLFYNFKGQIEFNNAVDVSNVTNMAGYFYKTEDINEDLSNWDTSNVTNMSRLFEHSNNFRAEISNWDTSNVTTMSGMFRFCKNFNSDVSDWKTSNVMDMSYIFADTEDFNVDMSKWNTSNVSDMSFMFYGSEKFNGDIRNLDTSNVNNMKSMFWGTKNFNPDMSMWDTSNVTDMSYMFHFSDMKDISLLNRGSTENTKAEYIFYQTTADTYKFKGLESFTFIFAVDYQVKNITKGTTENVNGGTQYNFLANDEYHLSRDAFTPIITYTVVFKDYDGTVLKTEEVEEGKSAIAPSTPSKEGYEFIGWNNSFTDVRSNIEVMAVYKRISDSSSSSASRYRSSYKKTSKKEEKKEDELGKEEIKETIVPEANFIMDESSSEAIVDNFSDMSEHWSKGYVQKAVQLGLFKGMSQTEFAPEKEATRAMIFALIHRMSGGKSDVKGGEDWYSGAMKWVKEKNISDGTDPNNEITREQLIAMLYRYMGTPKLSADLSSFNDSDKVSDYAKKAMAWAVKEGIIKGDPDGNLNPQASATRAEVAVILVELLKK